MADNQQQPQQMQLKISDDILKGAYANVVEVLHTPEEFILNFMNLFPPAGIVTSRVIVSPGHMKRIVAALQDNLKKYEEQFGQLKEVAPGVQPPQAVSSSGHNFGFDTTKAE